MDREVQSKIISAIQYITDHGFQYAIILILQLCMLIYWADAKSGFHEDEFYSIERAADYTGRGDVAQYITNSSDWGTGEWMYASELKKYIQVDREEEMFRIPAVEAIKRMLTDRNYFGFLNIAESIAPGYKTSKWPGMILNMVFWFISQLLIIKMGQKLGLRKLYVTLLMLLFGSCAYMIGLVTYIRFYIEVVMLIVLMLLLHLQIWFTPRPGVIMACLVGIGISAYLSLANSELTLIYYGSFIFCFWLSLIIRRDWKRLGWYSILPVGGAVYFVAGTNWVYLLKHLNDYMTYSDSRFGQYAGFIIDSLQNPSLDKILSVIIEMARVINLYCFVYKYVLFAWVVLLVIFAIHKLILSRQNQSVYVSTKSSMFTSMDGFVFVMLCSDLICVVFFILVGYIRWRYYSYGVVLFLIIFIYIVDRLTPGIDPKRTYIWTCLYNTVTTILVALMVLLPFAVRNIPCIYEESKAIVDSAEKYRSLDALMVDQVFDYGYNSTVAYESVYMSADDIDMYVITPDASNFPDNYSSDFLLWCNAWVDNSNTLNEIQSRGYATEHLGDDQYVSVYLCKGNYK